MPAPGILRHISITATTVVSYSRLKDSLSLEELWGCEASIQKGLTRKTADTVLKIKFKMSAYVSNIERLTNHEWTNEFRHKTVLLHCKLLLICILSWLMMYFFVLLIEFSTIRNYIAIQKFNVLAYPLKAETIYKSR